MALIAKLVKPKPGDKTFNLGHCMWLQGHKYLSHLSCVTKQFVGNWIKIGVSRMQEFAHRACQCIGWTT